MVTINLSLKKLFYLLFNRFIIKKRKLSLDNFFIVKTNKFISKRIILSQFMNYFYPYKKIFPQKFNVTSFQLKKLQSVCIYCNIKP